MRFDLRLFLLPASLAASLGAQTVLTWEQVKERFEAANPTLKAAQDSISESRASEITAHLRPNPEVNLTVDGVQVSPNQGIWQPLSGVVVTPGASYLIERRNK